MTSKVAFFSAVTFGLLAFALWSTQVAHLQTNPVKPKYVVEIDLATTLILPCLCDGKLMGGGLSRNWTGRTKVSVRVKNADGIPLNYDYSVTGGGVRPNGSSGVWDLATSAPGEYSITVTVDDGVGNSGSATRKVILAEPSCHCPCECPSMSVASHFTQVRPGGILDFEGRVWGGDIQRGGPSYNWTVDNGTVMSGQGTAAISVKAADSGEAVAATLKIGGTDRGCNCPVQASASVPMGSESKRQTFPTKINWLSMDEGELFIECPKGHVARPDSPASQDMIVDVNVGATSNSVNDKLHYTYKVSGGKVIGSGPNVKWDMTGVQPGTYNISVDVDDGKDGAISEKKVLNVYSRDCTWTPETPRVTISEPRPVEGSSDLIVAADISDVPYELELNWDVQGAEIIAGQNSRLIRIRPRKDARGEVTVTLNVQYHFGVGYFNADFPRTFRLQ